MIKVKQKTYEQKVLVCKYLCQKKQTIDRRNEYEPSFMQKKKKKNPYPSLAKPPIKDRRHKASCKQEKKKKKDQYLAI